jgi:hypothetical protein
MWWRRVWRSAWLVPVPILLLYGIYLFAFYGPGHDPRDAVLLGRHFVQMSDGSSVIKFDPSYRYPAGEIGYDGEFVYFIALDPINARYYVDAPSYRYTRIVYPLLARVLAAGQASLIPYTLLLINWLAIAAGTLFAALWLRRRQIWPWFALAYGLYPGLFIALTRDTTEPLAYGLVALGVLLWPRTPSPLAGDGRPNTPSPFVGEGRGGGSIIFSALAFAVAVLTRETAVIFPVLYGLGLLVGANTSEDRRARLREAGLVLALAIVPIVAYKLFLIAWLGREGDPGLLLERVPFLGLLAVEHSPGWVEEVRSVVVPALICAGAALVVVWRRRWLVEPWVLLLNVLLFVVLLHRSSYVDISASARVTTGVVLAAIFCLPVIQRVTASRSWFWSAGALWLSLVPFWVLIPELNWFIDLTRPFRHSL